MKFPLSSYPSWAAEFIEYQAGQVGASLGVLGMGVLAASSAIASQTALQVQRGYMVYSNLYCCIIATKGHGKTPALNACFDPVLQVYQRDRSAYQEAENLWQKENRTLYGKAKAEHMADRPPKPAYVQATSGTMEGLQEALAYNESIKKPPQIVVIKDELKAFFGGMNQYKKQGGVDMEFYLSIWNGMDVSIVNKSSDFTLRKGRLSLFGGMQPSVFREMFADNTQENGLMDRFLFEIITESRPPDRVFNREHDERVLNAYNSNITELYNDRRQEIILMDDASLEQIQAIRNKMTALAKRRNSTIDSKWEVNFFKLLINLMALWGESEITSGIIKKTEALSDYFCWSWLRSLDKTWECEADELRGLVIDYLKNNGAKSTMELRKIFGQRKYREILTDTLKRMVMAGHITEQVFRTTKPYSVYNLSEFTGDLGV